MTTREEIIAAAKEMMQARFDVRGSHLYGLTYRAMLAAAPKGEE